MIRKQLSNRKLEVSGGESGIRTHVRVSPKHAFQACAFNHSAISPGSDWIKMKRSGKRSRTQFSMRTPVKLRGA